MVSLRNIEPDFWPGGGVWKQVWRVELDLLWQKTGVIKKIKGYNRLQKTDMAGIMNNNTTISNFILHELRNIDEQTKPKTEHEFFTGWLTGESVQKHAEIALAILRRKKHFQRRKKIHGRILRKMGYSYIRLNNGVFTPIVDNKMYHCERITGIVHKAVIPFP